jgi:protoporphyrinogen/coproporphyrinogen III oxidase
MASMRLVVVGGGIAGLAAARTARLAAGEAGLLLDVTLLEASDRLGGKVWTETIDGVPLDWGPDSFLAAKPRARELAEELGLADDLVPTGPRAGRVYVLVGGDLRALPGGLVMGVPARPAALYEAVRRGVLSPAGALRAGMEPAIRKRTAPGASAGALARARLGPEAARRLVEPVMRAVHGVPGDQVGAETAFPWAIGRASLTVAAARRPRPSRTTFLGMRGGMGSLVEALASGLGEAKVRTGCPAGPIEEAESVYRVPAGGSVLEADGVILAAPAPDAAALLPSAAPEASRHLAGIGYSGSAVVLMRFGQGTLGRPLDASGYLVTPEEGGVVTACSFLPAKWPHLQDPSGAWLRAVITAPDALALPDEGLMHRAGVEVSTTMRARGGPERILIRRWHRALPIYGPGHAGRVAMGRAALPDRVAVAGAYVYGVGLSDCIRSGEDAARDVVGLLSRP